MNAEQKELFRKALLRVLDANRTRFGLSVVALSFQLGQFGFTPQNSGGVEALKEAIQDELDYLAGKQLVEEAQKTISAENRAWRLSPTGFAFVDANP